MKDRAEALVLEDNLQELTALAQRVGNAGLHPLAAQSAADALRLLDPAVHQPVIAIIDRDLSLAPDRSRRSEEVLRFLHANHSSCTALVYSGNLDSAEARAQVHIAHPRVLLHDKREGLSSLLARVEALVTPVVGDLRISDGRVVHIPSGRAASHRVAVSLVMNQPGGRATLLRSEATTRAARRFAAWLVEVDSCVRVDSLGGYLYRLEVVPR